MKITLDQHTYQIVDTIEKITIADSFVVRQNKLGTGNGEAKLYVGQESEKIRDFFGKEGFEVDCFMLKSDLLHYFKETISEYINPIQSYNYDNDFEQLLEDRTQKLNSLRNVITFKAKEQEQIKGPRIYISSAEANYNLIRELSFANISYLSILKLIDNKHQIKYYFRLFTDFFGETTHSSKILKEENLIKKSDEKETTKFQLIKSRLGQGIYREKLLKDCPFCPITLVSDSRILIASHIKPWINSSNEERLDPKNGLILTPTFDKLFDLGFLSFTDKKKTILSPYLSKDTYEKIKIKDNILISHLPIAGREEYLKYHRDNILKK